MPFLQKHNNEAASPVFTSQLLNRTRTEFLDPSDKEHFRLGYKTKQSKVIIQFYVQDTNY